MTLWEAARAVSTRFFAGAIFTATAGVTPTADIGHTLETLLG